MSVQQILAIHTGVQIASTQPPSISISRPLAIHTGVQIASQQLLQPCRRIHPRNSYWRTNCIQVTNQLIRWIGARNSYWRTNCINSQKGNKSHYSTRNSYWRTNCIVNMAQCLPILNDNFMQFFLQYDNISNSYFALGRLYCHSATGFIYLFCANLHRKL